MQFRHQGITLLAAGLLSCSQVSCHRTGADGENKVARRKPNIVLIVVDDLGYGDLGIYGNKVHHTPNIDQLAREGMIFTDFHSNGPVCSPTRASLMTGQYQQRSGIEQAIGFTLEKGMPLEKNTIAELLAAEGYVSGVFGKWHLGHVSRFGPNDQGFKKSVVSNNTPDYHTHISRTGQHDWFEDQEVKKEEGYLTDLVTDHALDFMRRNGQAAFFLFISHLAVHFPFQGPKDPPQRVAGGNWHDKKYGPLPETEYRRAYKDMLERVDHSIGEVVRYLDKAGLREETLIFVTSDNGAYQWVGSNYPYRGQKGDLLEGGHRIPAIANWPGRIRAGAVNTATLMTMDLAPTFASIAGIASPGVLTFDGADASDALFGNARLASRRLFWKFDDEQGKKSYAVREGPWKYLVTDGSRHLFHLDLDLTEKNDLKDSYPEVAARLDSAYGVWLESVSLP